MFNGFKASNTTKQGWKCQVAIRDEAEIHVQVPGSWDEDADEAAWRKYGAAFSVVTNELNDLVLAIKAADKPLASLYDSKRMYAEAIFDPKGVLYVGDKKFSVVAV